MLSIETKKYFSLLFVLLLLCRLLHLNDYFFLMRCQWHLSMQIVSNSPGSFLIISEYIFLRLNIVCKSFLIGSLCCFCRMSSVKSSVWFAFIIFCKLRRSVLSMIYYISFLKKVNVENAKKI